MHFFESFLDFIFIGGSFQIRIFRRLMSNALCFCPWVHFLALSLIVLLLLFLIWIHWNTKYPMDIFLETGFLALFGFLFFISYMYLLIRDWNFFNYAFPQFLFWDDFLVNSFEFSYWCLSTVYFMWYYPTLVTYSYFFVNSSWWSCFVNNFLAAISTIFLNSSSDCIKVDC